MLRPQAQGSGGSRSIYQRKFDQPETSDYTSLQERLGITPEGAEQPEAERAPDPKLLPQAELMTFAGAINEGIPANYLPYSFVDYIELVDWTGRALREDKRGAIPANLPPILERLGVDSQQWLQATKCIEKNFYQAIGPVASLEQLCQRLNKRWLHGTGACRNFYRSLAT